MECLRFYELHYVHCACLIIFIRAKDFFDGTYDEKYPWGGWCKTQISKSTRVLFFTKNDDYFLRNQWKMHIFVYYVAKSFATFVVISKTWNTFQRLNIF